MKDSYFMQLAIEEAKKAPVPFRCILVKDGEVIASGRSGKLIQKDLSGNIK